MSEKQVDDKPPNRRPRRTARSSRRRQETSEDVSVDVDREERSQRRQQQQQQTSTSTSAAAKKRQAVSSTVLQEDMEEDGLSLYELQEFVNVSFGDACDGRIDASKIGWEYTSDRRGGHVLFVENPKTGLLVETPIEGQAPTPGVEDEEDDEETPLVPGVAPRGGVDAALQQATGPTTPMQAVYMFMQGVLAGFSLALVYTISEASNDRDLLLDYQPSASESRRFFFIISCASLVGALDALIHSFYLQRTLSLYASQADGGTSSRSKLSSMRDLYSRQQQDRGLVAWETLMFPLAAWTFLCFSLCFLAVLIMGAAEVLIANKNGYSPPDDSTEDADAWVEDALDDSLFSDRFELWKDLASIYRSCLVVLIQHFLGGKREDDIKRLYDHISGLKQRISALQGDKFESSISPSDLRRLLAIQKLGVQRTESALATLQQADDDSQKS